MTDEYATEVSRRIEAPADRIFAILANPQRHTDLDGSGMLRGALSNEMITGVGDVFSMNMYLDEVGDYVMMNFVVEFEKNRRIGWEPAPGDARPFGRVGEGVEPLPGASGAVGYAQGADDAADRRCVGKHGELGATSE